MFARRILNGSRSRSELAAIAGEICAAEGLGVDIAQHRHLQLMLHVVWIRQSPVERVAQEGEDNPEDQAKSECQDSVPNGPGRARASRLSGRAGDLDGRRNLRDRPKLCGVLQGDLLFD